MITLKEGSLASTSGESSSRPTQSIEPIPRSDRTLVAVAAHRVTPQGGSITIRLNNPRPLLLEGTLLLLTATQSLALFGIGDIVFDPTSYASLVPQTTNAFHQFKMSESNITRFSIKQQSQTTSSAFKNANVRNMFGETNGLSTELNSSSPTAAESARC